ncbi:MAG: RcnB family protein [Caulobacteraceae bacterium]
MKRALIMASAALVLLGAGAASAAPHNRQSSGASSYRAPAPKSSSARAPRAAQPNYRAPRAQAQRQDWRGDRNHDGQLDRRWDRNGNGVVDRRWDRNNNGVVDRRFDRNMNGRLDQRWRRNTGPWVRDRNWFRNNWWISSGRRWYAPRYNWPYGYGYRRWAYGMILPQIFFNSSYYINDWYSYDLYEPPYGYVWIRVGSDILLVDPETGQIIQVVSGAFY